MEPKDTAIFEDIKTTTPRVIVKPSGFLHKPKTLGDRFAKVIVHFFAYLAHLFFGNRYGERAIVLETIAAVPGMVGGLLQHLKSLRFIRDDHGWIKTLIDEAENERMHLLIYSKIAKPTTFERMLIMVVQFFFYNFYFFLYLISPKTAHRTAGYFEEEAISSYTSYLALVREEKIHNVVAPQLALEYWGLNSDAKLEEMVEATIKDEIIHRDVNHGFADIL